MTTLSSGEVPREPYDGILWDEAAEAEWRKDVDRWRERFPAVAADPAALEQAMSSARWHVELELITRAIRAEFAVAERTHDNHAKLALRERWRAQYGWQMTELLLRVAKDPFRYKVYLS